MKKYLALAVVVSVPASGASVVKSPVLASPAQSSSVIAASQPPAGVQQVWRSAALTDGGYARCINPAGCHAFYSQDIIASYGTVWMYKWNGWTSPTGSDGIGRQIGAFWPLGNYEETGLGKEGFVDEWEGVD